MYHEPKDAKLEQGGMSTRQEEQNTVDMMRQWEKWGRKFNWGEEKVGQHTGRGKNNSKYISNSHQ